MSAVTLLVPRAKQFRLVVVHDCSAMRLPAYAGAAGGGAVTACYRPLICISGLALARCLVSRFHGSLRGHRCDLCSSTWIKRLLSTSPVLLGRYLLCWAVDAIDGFAAENPLLGHSPRTGQITSRLSVPHANGAMSLICCLGDLCTLRSCVPASYTCLLGGDAIDGFAVAVLF